MAYSSSRYEHSVLLERMLVIFFDLGVEMDHRLGPRYNSMGRAVAPFGYYQLRRVSDVPLSRWFWTVYFPELHRYILVL